MSRFLTNCTCLGLAALIWMPLLHLLFRPSLSNYVTDAGIPDRTRAMLNRHLADWEGRGRLEEDQARMRAMNPEWDFMGRTFLALSLVDAALRDAESAERCLETVDRIIDDTLRLEAEQGHRYFLLDYADDGRWVHPSERSVFVDGELALMMGARRLVEEKAAYREDLARRIPAIVRQMEAGRLHCAESYPDECWMFCNSVALAAVKVAEALDGGDYDSFFDRWLEKARESLVDSGTGLLVTSFTVDGRVLQGPEGSSIWLAIHCLRLVYPEFARDQYQRARRELGDSFLGFGYAREWPVSAGGPVDIDSGAVVPGLGLSPSSSAMALLAAISFGDEAFARSLLTSLEFAAFPAEEGDQLRFLASNQVGDAMALYGLLNQRLWEEVAAR